MITKKADSIRELLKRYAQLKRDQKIDEALSFRAEELATSAKQCEIPVKRAILLRERQWIQPREFPSVDIDKAREQIGKITELLPSDPEGVNKPAGQLEKTLQRVVDKLDVATANAWTEVVQRNKPTLEETILKRFENFDSTAQTITQIRGLFKDSSDANAPLDRDSLAAIENRWEKLAVLIAKLPNLSDDPDVIRFLNAIRNGGAPLSLLTDSVIKHLTEAGLFESFRIYHAK